MPTTTVASKLRNQIEEINHQVVPIVENEDGRNHGDMYEEHDQERPSEIPFAGSLVLGIAGNLDDAAKTGVVVAMPTLRVGLFRFVLVGIL